MPRQKSDTRKQAFEIWRDSNGEIKLKDIAEQLGVPDLKIRKWKSIDKWDEKFNGTFHKTKGNVPKREGAPKGNKNAVGHGAPRANINAVKHGFFRKIFPEDEETLDIISEIQAKSPIEILWEQIVIQYTAIARAQKIMFVKNKDDLTKHLKRIKDGSNFDEREWEMQYAWDKHANFLQAQSRAIATLERLIARYEELLLKDLGTEEQKLRIEIKKAELEKIKNPTPEADLASYIEALKPTAEEVWSEEDGDDTEEDDE
jgi:uncharacterized protein YjcR